MVGRLCDESYAIKIAGREEPIGSIHKDKETEWLILNMISLCCVYVLKSSIPLKAVQFKFFKVTEN